MAKVIEFYVRDLFPAKVKSVPRDRAAVFVPWAFCPDPNSDSGRYCGSISPGGREL
jgi:hypothetical protein